MTKIAITILGAESVYHRASEGFLSLARLADEAGIDQILVGDHVVMSANIDSYPFGTFPLPSPDYPAFEPLVLLAALAAVTKKVRLSTGILISPLRPAVLLAKQIATLDALSGGRVDIGFGAGWQKEEFEAAGVSWAGRFELMIEQIRACRALWRQGPSSFHGELISFDNVYCAPRPDQGEELPVLLGLTPTPRNIERIAAVGDGWIPPPTLEDKPDEFSAAATAIKAAMCARGRDPSNFQIRVPIAVVKDAGGRPDLEAMLSRAAPFIKGGATMLEFRLRQFLKSSDDVPRVMERLARVKERFA